MKTLGTINVHRKSDPMAPYVKYDVVADGKVLGQIGDGERKAFQTASGHHKIEIKYFGRVYSTLETDLKPHEVLNLEFGYPVPEVAYARILRVFVLGFILTWGPHIYEFFGGPALPPTIDVVVRLIALVLFVLLFFWFFQGAAEVLKLAFGSYAYLKVCDTK